MSGRSRGVKRQLTQEMILDPQKRVRELIEIGSSVQVDRAVPVKRYFRSGSEMERQARVYYAERQLDKAFILYNKFVTLFLEKLPKHHPEYNKPEYKVDRAKIKKLVKEAFPRAEELKKKLISRFDAEKDALEQKHAANAEARQREEEQKRAVEQREREEAERRLREETERREREEAERVAAFLAGSNVAGAGGSTGLSENDARDNQASTAPQPNANNEGVIPDITPNSEANWTVPTAEDTESEGHIVSTVDALTIEEPPTVRATPEGVSLTATNTDLAQVLPPTYEGPPAPNQNFTAQQTPPVTYLAPTAAQPPSSSVRTYQSIFSGPVAPSQSPQILPPSYTDHPPPANPYYSSAGAQGTQIPPGDPRMQYQPYYTQQGAPAQFYQPPPHPAYVPQYSTTSSSSSWGSVELPAPSYHMVPQPTRTQAIAEEEGEEPQGPPSVDRSTKPTYNALSTSIGGGYRMLYVPDSLSRRFEEAASPNTRQNIETCAILAGKLSQNQLHITHMILPKQRGGPDSCETLSEEELFDVQDQHDLITLGWIHTHPSQTAFMSSVDLHTHCSYQIMLDEAIAIVCAPKHGEVGVYMLTEPYGLDYITHCEEEGFHTHPKQPPLYEECKHVVFCQSPVDVVDLR